MDCVTLFLLFISDAAGLKFISDAIFAMAWQQINEGIAFGVTLVQGGG
jgi:hypothetical protein